MAESGYMLTKWLIMIFSALFGISLGFSLYQLIRDGIDFGDANVTVRLVSLVIGCVLCGLSFWGALQESAVLCYISLVFCGITLVVAIVHLLQCFKILGDRSCESEDYIVFGVGIILLALLTTSIYSFILSISR